MLAGGIPETQTRCLLPGPLLLGGGRHGSGGRVDEILEGARGDWRRLEAHIPAVEYGTPDENVFEAVDPLGRAV